MGAGTLEDPYRTLQVAPNADLEAIRTAYRRLARLYHPDLNPRPDAAERMRAINAAYRVLSDPAKRAAYDARRYLPRSTVVRSQPSATYYQAPARRPVVVVSSPPTELQRQVDRVVAVVGVMLLIAIGFYAVSVLPYAQQAFDSERQAMLGQSSGRYRSPAQSEAVATAQSAAQAPSGEHALGGSVVPDRLRADVGLQSFPGTVLVPPTSLPPFSSLPIVRLDATGQGIARYAVYYGDLSQGSAAISGLVGRASFDSAAPRLNDCAPEAEYCAGPVAGQSNGALPGIELFRAPNLVEDYPSFATHRVCCNGVFWSLSWYEPRANMSYSIDLSRTVAARYGGPTVDGQLAAARAVATLASQLVRLH